MALTYHDIQRLESRRVKLLRRKQETAWMTTARAVVGVVEILAVFLFLALIALPLGSLLIMFTR